MRPPNLKTRTRLIRAEVEEIIGAANWDSFDRFLDKDHRTVEIGFDGKYRYLVSDVKAFLHHIVYEGIQRCPYCGHDAKITIVGWMHYHRKRRTISEKCFDKECACDFRRFKGTKQAFLAWDRNIVGAAHYVGTFIYQ